MIGQFATEEERLTLARFMEQHGLTFRATYRGRGSHTDGWECDKWLVTYRKGALRFSCFFRMGLGHKGEPPTPESVLSCLADDAAGWENCRGPEEFMREYGYESYREAVRTYRAVDRQSRRLLAFLGEDAYQDLLWNTERE